LVHDRDRPPALGGLRPDAHPRCRLAPRAAAARVHIVAVRRRLRHRVRGGRGIHAAPGQGGTRSARRAGRRAGAIAPAHAPALGRVGRAAHRAGRGRGDGFQELTMDMGIDLPLLWAAIILFGIMMYVVMDGFDLGIGILFPFLPGRSDRDVMMNTVAPVWDGNETWLVLGGAGRLAACPLASAAVLSALYLPIILMLIGLVFRGVACEFRCKARDRRRHLWDKAFIGGSLVATFFHGVSLGAY